MRGRKLLSLLVGVTLVLASCADEGSGDEDSAGGLLDPGPDGPPDGAGDAGPRVDTELSLEDTIQLSIDEVQAFWAEQMPDAFGVEYTPIPSDRIYPFDADHEAPGCGPGDVFEYETWAGNVFYCPWTDDDGESEDGEDFVAYDAGQLLPDLFEEFGPGAVAMVMAHQWGHVVQDQVGAAGTSIVSETQADCFAGAWTAWAADGNSEVLAVDAGRLDLALGALLELRDEPGTPIDDPLAHGSGFDRVIAFQEGFTQGAERCAAYEVEPPQYVTLEWGQGDLAPGGQLSVEELVRLVPVDLNAYWQQIESGFEQVRAAEGFLLEGQMPTCGGTPIEEADARDLVRYCADENVVVYDAALFESVVEQLGDIGVALLLSDQWARAAQIQAGVTEETRETALERDCLSGSWLGNLHAFTTGGEQASGRVPGDDTYTLSLSPDDLYEAIAAFVAFSPSAADDPDDPLAAAFDRVAALAGGFFNGVESCRE